ncbi:MAG: hypothetical protein EBZ69_07610, partial [Alphaproteobacteria bacterium]|nr:hypothetical protein [Alphaproteobacteria bacterium]
MKSYSQRAPFNDWWYWTEALIKRFRTIGDVYKENMENERATDAHAWADKLRKNVNKVVDEMRKIGPKPNDEQKKKLAPLEEEAIFNAATLFREILLVFPFASGQMQEMLGIAWQDAKWEDDKKEPELDENGL